MFTLDINTDGLDAIAARLAATEEQVKAARKKALKNTRDGFKARFLAEVSDRTGAGKRYLSKRFFSDTPKKDDESLRIWIGSLPLDPYKVGTPQVYGIPGKSGGVRLGREDYPGHFLARIYGRQRIWIRVYAAGGERRNPNLIDGFQTGLGHGSHYNKPQHRLSAGDKYNRFPVTWAGYPVEEAIALFIQKEAPKLISRFENAFEVALKIESEIKNPWER